MAVFAALTGCATPANYQSMIVTPTKAISQNARLKNAIAIVNVSGGKATNPLWVSKVDNDAFKKALEGSLSAYGYLANNNAKYKLEANLLRLDQPMFGFEMKVESAVMYKISGAGITKKYPVQASGVAQVSDAFIANERIKIANERSIQKNIKEFLRKLGSF